MNISLFGQYNNKYAQNTSTTKTSNTETTLFMPSKPIFYKIKERSEDFSHRLKKIIYS